MQEFSTRALAAIAVSIALTTPGAVGAQGNASQRAEVERRVAAHARQYDGVAQQLWEFAEPGYQETRSADLLARELSAAGFRVQRPVGDIPTAFVAEWGSGRPIIGIMGEYDALPGLSQEALAEPKARVAGGHGHGCGHNLLGSASALAAVAVKETLEAGTLPGTIRFYGTPAEEGGSGKVFMSRAGVFRDADAVLHWHPHDRNIALSTSGTLAILSAKFRFTGQPAHAAAAPEKGRSALDGVLLMAHAIDMLREHVPTTARLHYVITRGGDAPNIVPGAAEIYLYARHPEMTVLDSIWERVLNAARAGALGTSTEMRVELVGGSAEVLPNDALARLIDRNLREVGGVTYASDEQAFADAIKATLPAENALPMGSQAAVRPPDEPTVLGSTDAGDVSWQVPTGWLLAATWVPGTANHTWQASATAGTSIGRKGMLVAARTLALTAIDLLTTPAEVQAARASFDARRSGRAYTSRIPADMKPPLTYRNQ